jgi:hypothetical protein
MRITITRSRRVTAGYITGFLLISSRVEPPALALDSSAVNRILVTGSTGNVGRHVVDLMNAASAYCRAMTRDHHAVIGPLDGGRRISLCQVERDPYAGM